MEALGRKLGPRGGLSEKDAYWSLNPTPDTPNVAQNLTDTLQNNQGRVQLLHMHPRYPVILNWPLGLLQLQGMAIDAKLCPQVTLGSRESIKGS